MSKKLFFILFLIFITLFIIISPKDKKKNDYNAYNNTKNKKKGNSSHYSDSEEEDSPFTENPYLILQIPPWTKFEDIQKRFITISAKAIAQNKTNTKKFKKMKNAYKVLEKEYEKNNKKEKTFFGVLMTTIKRILLYEFIMLGIVFITWFIYKFNTYAGVLVAAFVTIDNLIPHWFNTMITQYIVSFIFGTILYFNEFFCPFLCKKKGKEEDNQTHNNGNSNSSGSRKRRRFEKIE